MLFAEADLRSLTLDSDERAGLWMTTVQQIEKYLQTVDQLPTSRSVSRQEVLERLDQLDFCRGVSPEEAIDFAAKGLTDYQVHATHTRYFGLFNPGSTTMGIAADALAAAFNPQVATWTHSPFATEVEIRLIKELGRKFGYSADEVDGTFTSGGAEANHTALLCALNHRYPDFSTKGIRALPKEPVMYVSQQAHHSFVKAARFCGLGTEAVRQVAVDRNSAMSIEYLHRLIKQDLSEGKDPFFVAATFGTTNAGVLDPVQDVGEIARDYAMWFHVDAAWGGMAALVPELSHLCTGIDLADSITFDAHKKMSVPMGAGIFLTRHCDVLGDTCRITTDYMPPRADETYDPYTHSMQWSRRFIGLKVLLSLMVAGWDGYAAALRHQCQMGDLLRDKLQRAGWSLVNDTPLPVVCFVRAGEKPDYERFSQLVAAIVNSGRAWISTTRLADGLPVLRACITSYRTMPQDLDELVDALEEEGRKLWP